MTPYQQQQQQTMSRPLNIVSNLDSLSVSDVRRLLRRHNARTFHKPEECPACGENGIPRYHYQKRGSGNNGRHEIVLEYLHRNKEAEMAKNYKTNKMIKLYPRCVIGPLVSQRALFTEMMNAGSSKKRSRKAIGNTRTRTTRTTTTKSKS